MVDMTEPNEAQVKLLTGGMQSLVGVLGNLCAVLGEASRILPMRFGWRI